MWGRKVQINLNQALGPRIAGLHSLSILYLLLSYLLRLAPVQLNP